MEGHERSVKQEDSAQVSGDIIDNNTSRQPPPLNSGTGGSKQPKDPAFDQCSMRSREKLSLQDLGREIRENMSQGHNSCVFAFGQTGSGKCFSLLEVQEEPSLVSFFCSELFSSNHGGLKVLRVGISFVELYNEEIRDLLAPNGVQRAVEKIEYDPSGPYAEGLSHHYVSRYDDVKQMLIAGNKCRTTSAKSTIDEKCNQPWAIFTLTITYCNGPGASSELFSKVSFVDLEGSEGHAQFNLKEILMDINPPESSRAITDNCVGQTDSLLSWLLSQYLGGKTKATIVAMIDPRADNSQETLSTLSSAHRAKVIVIHPLRPNSSENMITDPLWNKLVNEKENSSLVKDNNHRLSNQNPERRNSDGDPTFNQLSAGQNIAGTTTTGNPPDNHTAQGSNCIINLEQRPGDSGHMDTDESQEELNKQAARLRLDGDKTDGLSSQNPQPEVAENVEDVCSSLTPQVPQDRAVTISRSETPHQGTTGNHINTDKYLMGEASNGQNTIENVAIFCWDALTAYNFQFLEDPLRKHLPMESMSYIPLCTASDDEWKCAAKKASYIVFYHSIQSGKSLDEATPYLDFCMGAHGPFKIFVMVTGLEDSDSVAVRNKWDLSRYHLCHLLLVTKDEMTKFYSTNKGLRTGERENMLEAELLTRPHRIGIFSRSAESNYQWLLSLLQSEFRDVVHEVRPCDISNIGAELSQCTVAILYHSMNRGEVNNEELKYISDILGKENVIVVVEGMKGRFLVEHSIGEYACDLLIITEAEKKDKARLMGRLESIRQSLKKPPKRKIRRDEQKEDRKKTCPDDELQQDIKVADDPGEMELGNQKYEKMKNGKYGQTMFIRKHHKIGIFSRSAESDYNWLQTSLRTEFRDLLVDIRAYYISNNGRRQFWEDVSQCTIGILYHTLKRGRLNITNVMDSLYEEELKYMAEVLGKENVIVVADDLQDSSSIEKHRILAQQPSIGEYSCDLVLLTPADKENKAQKMEKLKTIRSALHLKENEDNLLHINPLKPIKSIPNLFEYFPKFSSNAPQKPSFKQAEDTGIGNIDFSQRKTSRTERQWNSLFIRKHHKIGIFSRSSVSDYNWLQTSLRTEFRDLVVDVKAYYISNNGRRQFREDVSQCSVGILYHTLKRGSLNITNVMDSLYEEELRYMAETLGKENVFVVADDLEDSSSIEKHRILAQQLSIGEYSCDLVLLTPADKENKAQKMKKLETIRSALHFTSQFVNLYEEEDEDDQFKRITNIIMSLLTSLPEPVKKTMKEVTQRLDCASPEPLKIYFKQNKGRTVNLINILKDFYSKQHETHQNYRAMVPYTADDTSHLPTGTQEQCRRYGSGSGTQHQRRASEQQQYSQRPGTSERKSSWGGRMFSSLTDSVMQRVQGPSTKEKHKVGIFSRSAEDDYRWLHRLIISEFSDYVQRVRPCYISNTGRRQFWEDVSQCTVAILYHTKKRGRINITDVPGSLYDEELQYLAEQLGKDKVMVVVDDLEDSGPEEKESIRGSQRSIGKWASDLILISSTEKHYNHSTNSMYKQRLLQKFYRIAKV